MFNATTLFTLAGKLVLDSGEFNSSVNQAKGTFSGLGMSMDSAISKVKRGLVALTGGLAIGKLLKMGLSFNQQIQNYETNFGVLLQNEQKGIEMTERLKEMAAKTPFGITDLAGATQSLLAYGVEGEKVEGVLSNIGDIALGDKSKLQSIATVFGQISMAGKLLTQDYKQLLGQGFNPLTYISKRTGESLAELQDRMSKGGITIEEVTQAFKDATSEGGRFYQGMEKASETTSGLMSTLSDNWTEFIGNFTQPINDQLSEKVLPATISALGRISDALFGAEEASKKTKAELYGTDENGNNIDPNASLSTWYEDLIKTWTDGLPETDAIVSDYVTSFNTETDRIKKAMQDRLLDTANPLTEEQKVQFENGITDIEAMQARVNELLQKKANGTLTEDEKNELLDFLEKLNQYNSMLEGGGTASEEQTPIERIMDKLGDVSVTVIDGIADGIVNIINNWDSYKSILEAVLTLLIGAKGIKVALGLISTFASGPVTASIAAVSAAILGVITATKLMVDQWERTQERLKAEQEAYDNQEVVPITEPDGTTTFVPADSTHFVESESELSSRTGLPEPSLPAEDRWTLRGIVDDLAQATGGTGSTWQDFGLPSLPGVMAGTIPEAAAQAAKTAVEGADTSGMEDATYNGAYRGILDAAPNATFNVNYNAPAATRSNNQYQHRAAYGLGGR